MKKHLLLLLLLPFAAMCSVKDSITYKNVSYGKDAEQMIDIHLPANRTNATKTFLLLHGGGWSKGTKKQMDYMAKSLKKEFPDYAIVNINYRLATPQSPAYPKQIEDIEAVIALLEKNRNDYGLSGEYAFIGSSAGSHLALLYSYAFDKNKKIKAVCSMIGPVDFTDPSYTSNPKFSSSMLKNLVGAENTYENNRLLFEKVSPAYQVSKNAPPTIMFHGEDDPIVPKTQGPILKKKLDAYNIANELYIYKGEKHGKWTDENSKDIRKKMFAFLRKHF